MSPSQKSNYPNRKPDDDRSKPVKKSPFKSREELADWIEASLANLEKKLASFKTAHSMRAKITR